MASTSSTPKTESGVLIKQLKNADLVGGFPTDISFVDDEVLKGHDLLF